MSAEFAAGLVLGFVVGVLTFLAWCAVFIDGDDRREDE